MRFNLGPIPEDEAFDPVDEGWTPLREPSSAALMLVAIPVGIGMAAAVVWVWSVITPALGRVVGDDGFSASVSLGGLLSGLLALMGFVVLHELLHAIPVLLTGSRDAVVFGFWPRYLAPYFSTFEAVPRDVQLVSGALPFLVLTVLPLLFAAISALDSVWLLAVSALNAAACGGDLIVLGLYARQIPSNALVRNQGYSAWWKVSGS